MSKSKNTRDLVRIKTNQIQKITPATMDRLYARILTAVAVSSALLFGPIAAQAAEKGKGLVEEIIVTATFRETNLMDTPAAISAADADLIEQLGASDMTELFRSLPGLNMVSGNTGSNRFVIRGISSQTGTGSFAQTSAMVATYIDDTPMTSAQGPQRQLAGSLFDMQRVEVLKGPQGTLFGEGSQGGTVRYIYNEPDTEAFTSSVKAVANTQAESDDNSYRIDAGINIPLGDSFALRGSVFREDEAGFIDKTNIPGGGVSKDENTLVSTGGRLSAKWWINESLSAKATVFHVDTETKGSSVAQAPYVESVLGRLPGLEAANSSDKFTLGNLRFDYDFDFATFTSTTSYYDRKVNAITEAVPSSSFFLDIFIGFSANIGQYFADPTGGGDGSLFPIPCNMDPNLDPLNPPAPVFFGPFCPNGAGTTLQGIIGDNTAESSRFIQEFRLVSNSDGPLLWTAGLFFKDSKDSIRNVQPFAVAPGLESTRQFFFPILNDPGNTHEDTLKEISAFGELTYTLNEHWEVTLGARIANLKQEFENVTFETDDTPISPKFVLSWRPMEDHLYFFSYATGFRPGNVNNSMDFAARQLELNPLIPQATLDFVRSLITYEGDELINYELGAKWTLMDGQVRIAASAYYSDWQDAILDFTDTVNIPPGIAQSFNKNAGTAEVRGLELEINVAPTENLRLRVGADVNDSEIVDGDDKGNSLVYAPETSLTVGVDYTMPLGSLQGRLSANYSYVDEQFANSANDDLAHLDSYNITSMRYTVQHPSDERWSLALFVNNLFNDEIIVNKNQASAIDFNLVYERPRIIGLEFNWRTGR